MRRVIVLLSGEICAGKSTLARRLADGYGARVFRTREILESRSEGKKLGRTGLQKLGEQLDRETNGEWVVNELQTRVFRDYPSDCIFVIDSVRIPAQIEAFRCAYGIIVTHVHLHAPPDILAKRYEERETKGRLGPSIRGEYRRAKRDPTEAAVEQLREIADLSLDSHQSTPDDVLVRVASHVGLHSQFENATVDVVVGAQFGSEGKGQVAAHLAPEYDALVRVGGPNAGHTVFAKPEAHKFHLVPSGCIRASHAKLIIGPGSVLDLELLKNEIAQYKLEVGRLIIDRNATIITAEDKKREAKLVAAIGSTGQGVGAATARNILDRVRNNGHFKAGRYETDLRGYLGSSQVELEKIFRSNGRVLLEGTQGTGLSLHHGTYPHVTSRDTTVAGCLSEAGIPPRRVRKIVLVTRTYPIRVQNPNNGTSGRFESPEISWEEIAARSGNDASELRRRERTTTTNRERRVAEFSWSAFRRACELNSPTDIALTFVDYLSINNTKARRFEQLTDETIRFIDELERCAGVRVSLISTRFEFKCIIDRRQWKDLN